MLKTAVTIMIQVGTVTGILNASSIPVTTALKSPAVTCFFVSFCHKYSVSTHTATESPVRYRARIPKK